MNAMDILTGLNDVRDRYIVDTEAFRQAAPKKRQLPRKRLWLIAAIVALALLLVGCATLYVLHLQDMAFGQEQRAGSSGSSETWFKLSLQGVEGTPGYLAQKEWHEWLETYDPNDEIYHSEEAFSEDFGEEYEAYLLYTRAMKDKLDEICAKYHLNLLGKMHRDPDPEAACQALGIRGILRVPAETELAFRYYADGSFTAEGTVTLTGPDAVWPYGEVLSFSAFRKNSFNDVYSMIPKENFTEWNYRTSYGADVLIVSVEGTEDGTWVSGASLFADGGDYMIHLNLTEYDRTWTKEALESYAEAFDFTVQPQEVSPEALAQTDARQAAYDKAWAEQYQKRLHGYAELGYDSRIKDWLTISTHPNQLGFCLTDLNGDGVEELLLGENGYIQEAYCKTEDGTQRIMPPTVMYYGAFLESNRYLSDITSDYSLHPSYMYLCQDNVLAYVFVAQDFTAYHFAKPENGEYVWDKCVFYSTIEYYREHPWNLYEDGPGSNAIPITQEEFNAIIRSYTRVPVTLTPISQYPLDASSTSNVGEDTVYTSFDALRTSLSGLADAQDWHYCLIDLDGDGQDEFFLSHKDWNGLLAMKDGQVKLLECGRNISIFQGGFACTRQYLDGNSATGFYKVEHGDAILVDYLRYDTGKNAECPWFCSPDGQDDTLRPITQAEYEAIQAKYAPIELDMRADLVYSGE